MGGGIITAVWIPLQASIGLVPIMLVTAAVLVGIGLVWAIAVRPHFSGRRTRAYAGRGVAQAAVAIPTAEDAARLRRMSQNPTTPSADCL